MSHASFAAILLLYLLSLFHCITTSQALSVYAAGRGLMTESTKSASEVIALSGKTNPTLLYLGTARYDNPQGAQIDTQNYAALGCSITALNVSWTDPSEAETTEAIESADIILIAGGNTLFAVDRWIKLGIDLHIQRAIQTRNVVLAGGSAGFISLCNGGHSDSMEPHSYKNPVGPLLNSNSNVRDAVDRTWEYIRVPGLGIIDSMCCPHYDVRQNNGVSRADDFTNMMKRHVGEYAIAVDEWAALVINGDDYHVISRENHTGSVAIDGSFAANSTGIPGIWSISIDGNTGQMIRTLVPESGKVEDIIRPPRWVVDDPMVWIARKQNPDDGQPADWMKVQSGRGVQPLHYIILFAIFAIIGAIIILQRRTREILCRYEQIERPCIS